MFKWSLKQLQISSALPLNTDGLPLAGSLSGAAAVAAGLGVCDIAGLRSATARRVLQSGESALCAERLSNEQGT